MSFNSLYSTVLHELGITLWQNRNKPIINNVVYADIATVDEQKLLENMMFVLSKNNKWILFETKSYFATQSTNNLNQQIFIFSGSDYKTIAPLVYNFPCLSALINNSDLKKQIWQQHLPFWA